MTSRPVAERAAFVTAVLGVAMGLLFVFAPIQGYCRSEIRGTPGAPATPGPTICGRQSLIQAQPIWPMPLIAIVVWSFAPLVTYIGVRRRTVDVASGTAVIILGLFLELTVLISFGAAPFFAPFVLLPLLITTALALASRPRPRMT
ncbi:MAG TPA: hypothetical protein VJP45_04280 [Candidatus Limnocylindria bacterium]|nr:hypothetical protein [Candidatus Limnocylindria bacterium]